MFYDADTAHPGVRPGGLIHGGFYDAPPPPGRSTYTGNHIGVGPDVWYTNHHYDTTVSETRITTYLGILTGQIPAQAVLRHVAHLPGDAATGRGTRCSRSGENRTYLGLDVYEGAYTYRGMHIVPGWGGSMFEELMPDVFVAGGELGAAQLGRQPPAARPGPARARPRRGRVRLLGLLARRATPFGGYREYGVDALGLNPDGYFSDEEKTNYDAGFGDCRAGDEPDADLRRRRRHPARVVPRDDARAAAGLRQPREHPGRASTPTAAAASSTRSRCGRAPIARRYLSLDQAMVMGAVGQRPRQTT